MAEKEVLENEKETSIMNILEDFQKERYKRKRKHRQMLNSKIKLLAELKMFKSNYKNLAKKIGAISAVSKNRE